MKILELLTEQEVLYHLGAPVPTSSLRPLTFFTDRESAATFADTASYTNPKIHLVVNNIERPATERDVVQAAKQAGCYEPHVQPVDYVTQAYYGPKALEIANILKNAGFDGIILPDVAADNKTKITSYIPFERRPIN